MKRKAKKPVEHKKKDTFLDPLKEVAASIDPALIAKMRGGQPDEQTGGWSE